MSTPFVPRIHAMPDSGNCYKPCLLLDLLGREYEWVDVDPFAGETRSPDFLAKNPLGRLPVLEYAPGAFLAESNAMLVYLSQGTRFWPDDPIRQARILAWLFFEQNNHEVWIASSRFLLMFTEATPESPEIRFRREPGLRALAQMEAHLEHQPWFGTATVGIADIALFAYTHVADEGGFGLDSYPAIRAWLDRVRAEPGFRAMRRRATGNIQARPQAAATHYHPCPLRAPPRFDMTKAFLIFCGIVYLGFGLWVLIAPESGLAYTSLSLEPVDGLSDLRGSHGGMNVVVGLFLLYAIATARHLRAGLLLVALLNSGYVLGRTVGLAADGLPGPGILAALVFEIGLVGIALWLAAREPAGRAGANV